MNKLNVIKKIVFLSLVVTVLTSFSLYKINTDKSFLIGKSKSTNSKLKGYKYKLQPIVFDALEKMKTAALKKGVRIDVVSAYRGFEHQNRLWERKFRKYKNQGLSTKQAVLKVTEYTAIPGTSRHHWGTEVDLRDYSKHNSPNLRSQKDSKYEKWMQENAHKFGFYLAYTDNKFRKGYKFESWHYSYREISKPLLIEYLKLDISKILKQEHILGNQIFTKKFIQEYINEHVLGINGNLF